MKGVKVQNNLGLITISSNGGGYTVTDKAIARQMFKYLIDCKLNKTNKAHGPRPKNI